MLSIGRTLLYARTVRQLRWEQLVYRPVRSVQSRLPVRLNPQVESPGAGQFARLSHEVRSWPWMHVRTGAATADAVLRGEYRFLNHTERLPAPDWSRRHVNHLWSYNLHYFDYALALAQAFRVSGDSRYLRRLLEVIDHWIEGNPPGRGDGWEPYAVSLRVVNWIYSILLVGDALETEPRTCIEESIASQVEFLSGRMELHIMANHLLKNVKALVVAGLYFTGRSAGRWIAEGVAALWQELAEQVQFDGTHYERTPMYHAIVLGDYLEVVALLRASGAEVPQGVPAKLRRMMDALAVLSRPGGSLHLFNDTACGIAPPQGWLEPLARRVLHWDTPAPNQHLLLPDGGYRGFQDAESGERLLIDCGEPAPRHQPGHAHCGLLGFELDVAGLPLAVDAGVHGYDGDPFREYVRSVRAHNTVSLGGLEQSELWGTFRIARRAALRGATSRIESGTFRFEGSYSPYYDREVVHSRAIEGRPGSWSITDRVIGGHGSPRYSFLHLHPRWTAEVCGSSIVARAGAAETVIETFGVDRIRLARGEWDPIQGWYCPEFGSAIPAVAIEMECSGDEANPFGYRIRSVKRSA